MSRYHRLPIAQKRAEGIARMRAPAVTCPICDTQVMPTDLKAHIDQRCPGPREVGPGDRWLSSREALALGVTDMTLSRWSRSAEGKPLKVRTRGTRGDRQYLERDLQMQLARRRY